MESWGEAGGNWWGDGGGGKRRVALPAGEPSLDLDDPATELYGPDAMEAVDRFRADEGWAVAVSGYVDQRTVDRLWSRLEAEGRAEAVRRRILEVARITR